MNDIVVMRYQYEDLLILNSKNLCSVNPQLVFFFQKISITKSNKIYYPNKFNIYFNKKRSRPKKVLCQDPEIIRKIRSVLSKITSQNYDKLYEQLTNHLDKYAFDDSEIGEHIYNCIIDNIFHIDTYINLLTCLELNHPKIIYYVHKLITDQAKNPKQCLKNTISESMQDKEKRWQISNAILLTKLYVKNKYSKEFLNECVSIWLLKTTLNHVMGLEIMIKITPLLDTKSLYQNNAKLLNDFAKNVDYPPRLRYLLHALNHKTPFNSLN